MPEQSAEQLALDAGKVFTPAVPVSDKDLFAGRIEEIRRIVDAINQRGQHAAIFGERGVGKTSLANIISSKLTGNVPIMAPHVTCDSTDTFESLWRKVLSDIDLIQKKRQAGFQQLTIFEETRAAADVVGPTVSPDDLRRLFTLLGEGKIMIVILDEFDRLTNLAARRAVADTIKSFSDHGVPVTVIVVGVADTIADLIAEHESIERALVQVQMPRMAPHELIEILEKGTSRLNMEIQGVAEHFIATLSQGLPHYTHLLALHAARITLDAGDDEIRMEHVQPAIGKAVADSQASLRTDLRKAITSPQQGNIFSQVLVAAALAKTDEFGYFGASAVREPLSRIMGRPYSIPSYVRHLKAFCQADRGRVLEKFGEKHKIKYRFTNALMPPLIIMKGLVDQRVSGPMVQEIHPR